MTASVYAVLCCVALLGLTTTVTILSCACGGREDDPYVGYWRIPSPSSVGHTLLVVRSVHGSYEYRLDTLPWRRADVGDNGLRLQRYRGEGPVVSQGLDVELREGEATILVSASPLPVPYALTRLNEDEYLTTLNAEADDELQLTAFGLSELAKEWATQHGGEPPAAADMTSDSAFGRYVAQRIVRWPWNPFTGEEMHAATEPGDFTYTTDGHNFRLIVHSCDGTPVTP